MNTIHRNPWMNLFFQTVMDHATVTSMSASEKTLNPNFYLYQRLIHLKLLLLNWWVFSVLFTETCGKTICNCLFKKTTIRDVRKHETGYHEFSIMLEY